MEPVLHADSNRVYGLTGHALRMNPDFAPQQPSRLPTFREAMVFWFWLGCVSFGGPAGQIAMMHRELVERRRWFGEAHFLHALNFCMLLPGPEAQQLATYLGWRMHGVRGAIAAGGLFVLPAALLLLALSWLYVTRGQTGWLAGAFHGLQPAVIAIVAAAVIKIGSRTLHTPTQWVIAAVSFAAISVGSISFVWILLGALAVGWVGSRRFPAQFRTVDASRPARGSEADAAVSVGLPEVPPPKWSDAARIAACGFVLWLVAIACAHRLQGPGGVLGDQGWFFTKAAFVTFGGAYAVLPYVAQQAVEHHGWLTHDQMLAGLGLAETTPGPLIMVLQFVGFVGAWQQPGGLTPLAAATAGAALTTWVTFLPSFVFILIGGPHVEKLGEQPRLSASLSAITAAVVGVILSLAVWFARHAMWPVPGRFDPFVAVLAVVAFVAMTRFRAGLLPVLAACAALGVVWELVGTR